MALDQQTFDFLKQRWTANGGPPGRSDLAASIAFAESSGCQWALAGPVDIRPVKTCTWHVTNGENSCGYWQINLRAHPQYSAPSIFNANVNARAAVEISGDGESFNAWSTYTNGAYLAFLTKYGGTGSPEPPPPPEPQPLGDGELAADGVWNQGWQHLTGVLAHRLPTALAESHHLGTRTLRTLHRGSKVR